MLVAELGRYRVKEDSFYDEKYRYYLVTGIAKSPAISIIAKGVDNNKVDGDVGMSGVAEVSTSISIQKSGENRITFRGNRKLAFGIELHELDYNRVNKRIRLKLVDQPFIVRKKDEEVRTHKVLNPAFIEDTDGGHIFIIID